ncbi:MAG TPA: DNA-3-methyladenine glycosylase [Planctomycetaceae bacterium]|nr:DNA-3-methyladenine glycosylase [Planctomycetaceae bacterium]
MHKSFLTRRGEVITAATTHLKKSDKTLARLIDRVGPFTLKLHRDRFDLLVRSILSQQISTKAARSIRLKLEGLTHGAGINPESLTRLTDVQLRSAGLSGQKVSYLRDLTAHVQDGRLELARLHRLSDEDAIAELVAVKGIGEWTAQMFLMFSLGRTDVLPHGDLGLRASVKTLYRLPDLPDKKTFLTIATPWRPYATIASWYVWRLSDLQSDPDMDASAYPV